MDRTKIGDRMKAYENVTRSYVDTNLPVVVRLDGKAFHTWTKNFGKPFDSTLNDAFQSAMVATCKEVGQILFGYSQSDEVTFVLNGWQKETSQVWFDGNIQKIVSVISSIFTAYFNKSFIIDFTPAFFDARVFNVPKHEVVNLLIWRQQDAIRNSISGLAQSLYSHKQLHGKKTNEMKEMCIKKGVVWDELSSIQKYGFVVYKEYYTIVVADGEAERSRWSVDTDIPIFTENKEYITELIKSKESEDDEEFTY